MSKLKLAWVENDKARALTLKRRREGLLRKVKELSILCDIWVCLIIFSPNEVEPVVWPSAERARDLLNDFFALPKFEQKNKETSVESFLKKKTEAVHKQLMKSNKKTKEYVTDELMLHLQHGRGIEDLNLTEIYALLSYSKEKILLCRKKSNFMKFSPLRDPLVLPSEVKVKQLTITTNDSFVGGVQDDDKTEFDPKPLEHVSHCPYQGSSSNGNASLEMEPIYPFVTCFHGLVGSASQQLQHRNMTNNPILAMNQPKQYLFDFMSREQEIEEEKNNINTQIYRGNNTMTTNNNACQEPPLSETTVREDNVNLMSLDIDRDWLSL
ncbi:PREDICTED: agamous-like MADS-box protein AGL92 [Camelina sativa]|uniref:Agamous-like MADS-box protein AGL92 n=1 Tax=Camelina sativa TaxID=90675 RepID=A0ABM0U6G6_CAMSA|nr:PREDICTED: agamous-like MADS-box protein AGL92 [Camelina sativa]